MGVGSERLQGEAFGEVGDGSGYVICAADLEFLDISPADVDALIERSRPLGMSQEEYQEVIDGLLHALERENVTDADVRIQGSSAHFFSGWHKPLPSRVEHVFDALSDLSVELPQRGETEGIWRRLVTQWPEAGTRPHRRPFDSMHRLGLDPYPSDYDIQICSDSMMGKVREGLARQHLDPEHVRVKNQKYSFVEKKYSENFFLYISAWALRASKLVGRPVTWVLFPSSGPEKDQKDERLSSHFKPSDWIVITPRRSGILEEV